MWDEDWRARFEIIGQLFDAFTMDQRTTDDPGSKLRAVTAAEIVALCRHLLECNESELPTDARAAVSAVLSQLLLDAPTGTVQNRVEEVITVCGDPAMEDLLEINNVQCHVVRQLSGTIHALLGTAFMRHSSGARESNVERALTHFHAALGASTFEGHAAIHAAIHHNLGALYVQRTLGSAGDNSARAIEHLNAALAQTHKQSDPIRWAVIQSDLGLANLASGDASEDAIRRFRNALSILTRSTQPRLWANCQYRLGLALLHSRNGGSNEHLEAAIDYFNQALAIFRADGFRDERILTLLDLGRAYIRRHEGRLADNVTIAIDVLEQAADLSQSPRYAHISGSIRCTLGHAYHRRGAANNDRNDLNRAVDCYQDGLSALDRQKRPAMYRVARTRLAGARRAVVELERGTDS